MAKISAALKRIKDNKGFLSAYTQAMSLLHQVGLLDFLRENGRILPVSPEAPNYEAYQAAIANWSIGYNTSLDHLIQFRELFLDEPATVGDLNPDFGSLEASIESGDLTEEEANAIRNGQPIPTLKPVNTVTGVALTSSKS